jgi:hypothetical protein
MKYIPFIFFLIHLIKPITNTTLSLNPMMIRNTGLRFLILCNFKKCKNSLHHFKHIFQDKIYFIYETSKFKYSEYYSLSENDRIVIETIIGFII